jgi:hypothetical protein
MLKSEFVLKKEIGSKKVEKREKFLAINEHYLPSNDPNPFSLGSVFLHTFF